EPVDDVVQTQLQALQQNFAGDAFAPGRFFIVAAERTLGQAVNAPHFLLFAQLQAEFRRVPAPGLAVLAWGIVAPFNGALGCITAFALEEEFEPFPAAQTTNRSCISGHIL